MYGYKETVQTFVQSSVQGLVKTSVDQCMVWDMILYRVRSRLQFSDQCRVWCRVKFKGCPGLRLGFGSGFGVGLGPRFDPGLGVGFGAWLATRSSVGVAENTH